MKPSLISDTLKARLASGMHRGVLIEGSPGLGKTQILSQIAREAGIGFKIVHAPLMQPEDYGMPVVNLQRNNVKFVVPSDKFPIEGTDCPDTGILVLDELPQADNAGQKILANLIQERSIHESKIKPGWMIVATGNRSKDRAGANRILSHLRNRMTTLEFTPDLDDWCNWYMDQDEYKTELLSFIRFRPGLLSDFDPQREVNPTPRAWVEGVGAALGNMPPEAELDVIKGDVGEGPAAEFIAFLQIYRNLPNPDAVLMDPDKHEVPTSTQVLYALCGALGRRASEDNFERLTKFVARLPGEFGVLCIKDACRHDPKVAHTKAFARWASGPGAHLLT